MEAANEISYSLSHGYYELCHREKGQNFNSGL